MQAFWEWLFLVAIRKIKATRLRSGRIAEALTHCTINLVVKVVLIRKADKGLEVYLVKHRNGKAGNNHLACPTAQVGWGQQVAQTLDELVQSLFRTTKASYTPCGVYCYEQGGKSYAAEICLVQLKREFQDGVWHSADRIMADATVFEADREIVTRALVAWRTNHAHL